MRSSFCRLERLEGAHEVVEGIGHVVARATRGAVARGLGLDVSNTRVFGTNVFGQMLFAHVILFLGASLRKVKSRDARPFPGHPRFEMLMLSEAG